MSTILTHNLASGTSYRYCDIFVIGMDYNILESYVGINYGSRDKESPQNGVKLINVYGIVSQL